MAIYFYRKLGRMDRGKYAVKYALQLYENVVQNYIEIGISSSAATLKGVLGKKLKIHVIDIC